MESSQDRNQIAEELAFILQDFLKRKPVLQSVTVGLNWPTYHPVNEPPGMIVTAAGEVNKLDGIELRHMLHQWLFVHERLVRMLVNASQDAEYKLLDAITTLRYVEALHDKARQAKLETPFRQILQIAESEGYGTTIANFDEWFCKQRPLHQEEKGEDEAGRRSEADGGPGDGPADPPPILQNSR